MQSFGVDITALEISESSDSEISLDINQDLLEECKTKEGPDENSKKKCITKEDLLKYETSLQQCFCQKREEFRTTYWDLVAKIQTKTKTKLLLKEEIATLIGML